MPTPVRSRRFFGPILVAASPTILYTVPAARTAVIKTISVVNGSLAAVTFTLRINSGAGANPIYINVVAAASTILLFDLVVLNPADVLSVTTPTVNALQIAAFGSLLDGSPS